MGGQMHRPGFGYTNNTLISYHFSVPCPGPTEAHPRGWERQNPATSRPASTFFAIRMFNSRDEPGPPVTNFRPGSFCTSAYRTTFNGYLPVTSEENSARSTELLVETSIDESRGT